MSAGQLDMGKALLLRRLLELLFKLGNVLPGFYGRRTGYSTQQGLLVNLFALGLACRRHGVASLNDAQFYGKCWRLSPFESVANARFCGEENK